jgi:hypothetical protein
VTGWCYLNHTLARVLVTAITDILMNNGMKVFSIKAQNRNEWTAIKREAKVKLKGP